MCTEFDEGDIELLPMEKVRLVWNGEAFADPKQIRLLDQWRASGDSQAVLTFKFSCSEKARCDGLAKAMRDRPATFGDLQFQFVVNGPR